MAKFCVYCGKEVEKNDNVCGNCGKAINNNVQTVVTKKQTNKEQRTLNKPNLQYQTTEHCIFNPSTFSKQWRTSKYLQSDIPFKTIRT